MGLIVLFVLSAVLPIIGFGRLLWRVQARIRELDRRIEARGGKAGLTVGDVADLSKGDIRAPYYTERADLWWDTLLVGLGLACGALGSILSL